MLRSNRRVPLKPLLLLAFTLGCSAAPITIQAEFCAVTDGAVGPPTFCEPGQYFLSDPVAVDATPGAVEFSNFHGTLFDVQEDGALLMQLMEPVSVPDALHAPRWAFYSDFTGDGENDFDPSSVLTVAIPGVRNTDYYLEFFETVRVFWIPRVSLDAFEPGTDTALVVPFEGEGGQIPEPSAMMLIGAALVTIGVVGRRKLR
jgi:hypothetical protein